MFDPAERQAIIANVAVKENDYRVIIETACIDSTNELLVVKQAYHALFKHSLEEDVASHATGEFRKVYMLLRNSDRLTTSDQFSD